MNKKSLAAISSGGLIISLITIIKFVTDFNIRNLRTYMDMKTWGLIAAWSLAVFSIIILVQSIIDFNKEKE